MKINIETEWHPWYIEQSQGGYFRTCCSCCSPFPEENKQNQNKPKANKKRNKTKRNETPRMTFPFPLFIQYYNITICNTIILLWTLCMSSNDFYDVNKKQKNRWRELSNQFSFQDSSCPYSLPLLSSLIRYLRKISLLGWQSSLLATLAYPKACSG